ncbi:hypothetical protein D3C86_1562940 [compost metagenome]
MATPAASAPSGEPSKSAMMASPMYLSMKPSCSRMMGPIWPRYELMKLKFSCGVICSERVVKARMSEKRTVILRCTWSPRRTSTMLSLFKMRMSWLGTKRVVAASSSSLRRSRTRRRSESSSTVAKARAKRFASMKDWAKMKANRPKWTT